MWTLLHQVVDWLNSNQGVLSVALFVAGLIVAWGSGLFRVLRRKPDLRVELLPGPTFWAMRGRDTDEGPPVFVAAFAMYVSVANVGPAPTSIVTARIGYRLMVPPFSRQGLRYFWRRYWHDGPTTSLHDFIYQFSDQAKVFPFLLQATATLQKSTDCYLPEGRHVSGVLYFEQPESWGGARPLEVGHRTSVKLSLIDGAGRSHSNTFSIERVELEQALRYCKSFAQSRERMVQPPDIDAAGDDGEPRGDHERR